MVGLEDGGRDAMPVEELAYLTGVLGGDAIHPSENFERPQGYVGKIPDGSGHKIEDTWTGVAAGSRRVRSFVH
jgi:hypothetical protein